MNDKVVDYYFAPVSPWTYLGHERFVALLQATSFRGPWPFLLAAVALSWARVREGRHTPPEVLGAWGIAGASGVLTRWVG